MKKKKGFISTTVVYAFFFVFLMILMYIVATYASTRTLLRSVKNDVKNDLSDVNFARYLINHHLEEGFKLDNHEIYDELGAKDNSYRFSGQNPDNYLCFGSEEDECPSENLYRIIGVFGNKVKIIKNSDYTKEVTTIPEPNPDGTQDPPTTEVVHNHAWDTSSSNVWINSSLLIELNTTFLNSLGDYTDLISYSDWYTEGMDLNNLELTPALVVQNERDSASYNIITAKIGLLYVSDYIYATSKDGWETTLNDYGSTTDNNWLFDEESNFWTLTKVKSDTNNDISEIYDQVFYINNYGEIATDLTTATYQIRPVFYLNSNVKRLSGNGTITDPYRVI